MKNDVKTEILESIERFKDKTWIERDIQTLCEAAVESIHLSEKLDKIKNAKELEELRRACRGMFDETITTRRNDDNELKCVACSCNLSNGEKHSSACPIDRAVRALFKNEDLP